MKIRKTAIFDLDGTLHHTEKALVPAIQMAMSDLGFQPAAPADINALYGEPLEIFCRKLLNSNDETCREFRNGIRSYQTITLHEKGALYPGTREMLSALQAMGFDLAICSNADLDYIELVTSSLGIADMFSLLEGKDDHASKTRRVKKIIENNRSSFSVMIGDRYHDINAAAENGIPSIGCLYGYGDQAEIQKADHPVSSPIEIADVVRMLLKKFTGF